MFKKFLLFLMGLTLALPIIAHSATFYVSSLGGNDANQGTSEAEPWQTIDKIKSVQFDDGSTILFKRGEVFRGSIITGKFPKGITYGAYGEGNTPVISGSIAITGWTPARSIGRNVYQADLSGLPLGEEETIYYLFVNGELMTLARYPNVDSPAQTNWLNVEKEGMNAFTDSHLKGYKNSNNYWKGATLRIRNYSWHYVVREITGYSNGKISAKGLEEQLPEWGYFLDNKLEELDHPGEWYYDADAKKVYFYPRFNVDPNTLLVEGSTYKMGLYIANQQNNTLVENLSFRHFAAKAVHVGGSDDCTIRNNYFEYNNRGVTAWDSPNVLIANNTFNNQIRTAILVEGSDNFDLKNSIIEKNKITNTALFPAYGLRFDGIYNGAAMRVFGKAYTVRQNTIERSSHGGILLKDGGHHLVENNIIRQSLLLLNDGGAIVISSDGNIIRNNFLLESFGNIDESNGCSNTKRTPCSKHPSYGMGIGANPVAKDNVIEGNTIAHNQHEGIRLNAFINTTVRNNVVFNNLHQIIIEDKKGPSRNNVVEGNVLFSLTPDQIGLQMSDTNHGTFDKNTYCNPYNTVAVVRGETRYSLAHWQNKFSVDKKSKWCGLPILENSGLKENRFTSLGASLVKTTFDTDVSGWNNSGSAVISHDPNRRNMDGGSLKRTLNSKSTNANITSDVFDLVENQLYRLKFSVISDGLGTIRVRVNDTGAGGSDILKERFVGYDQNRKDFEVFFQSSVTTSLGKVLFITDKEHKDHAEYWLDNIALEPVDVTVNDELLTSVFFTNMTENPKTINLGNATYLDLNGRTEVKNSLELKPFSSKILIHVSGATPPTVILSTSKKKYRQGDTLRVTLPPLPTDWVKYVGIVLPSNQFYLLTDTNQFVPYDGTELPAWEGGNVAMEFVLNNVQKGQYTLYLLRLPKGLNPVSEGKWANQKYWKWGVNTFQIE
ncbi:right-handed parallel beta-helix repeat-containing protein [Candidatus Parabeggiatoa sp. HSG14]|uniref:right-handed parallel beta-helix repeat-containing protein n=1 Tax=Candidatus Parabeggiatoa sp. HSG14 TaxID=3055593 RepID=UPI0025A8B39B|nr:right-handed parallel beta-helix repeat-containing protein [Thiotrichales bacterium HSG14]